MIITDLLERNAKLHPDDVALVEINPANQPDVNLPWREYSLIETAPGGKYRREMTWREFDTRANRFANLLLSRGIKKGDKVVKRAISVAVPPQLSEQTNKPDISEYAAVCGYAVILSGK